MRDDDKTTGLLRPGRMSWGHVIAGLVVAILCVMVLPTVLMLGPGGMGADGAGADAESAQSPAWLPLVQFTVLTVVALWFLRRVRSETDAENPAWRPRRFLGMPMVKMLAVVGLLAALFAVAANLLMDVPDETSPLAMVNQLGLGESAWSDLLIIAGVAVAAPVGEELVFRGLMFRGAFDAMARRRQVGASLMVSLLVAGAISTLAFAVMHQRGEVDQMAFLILLGAFACIVYWATGTLTSAVWVHAVVNAIGLAFALFVASEVGAPWHVIALVAAPPLAVAVMAAVSRAAGTARL
ncbi:CPBP family intramembrane glutamic endopeptidase [uncultured Corynebacterium sp.]|uniref:CPBP family intramembrane glutamic endopeptidase n=1 Tax=uncultured Corynebacterium sp. TaxID=159447 RepID=UPI0026010C77|nr:CPBP family intramembrane glutamic endopeptidase [uncultured Corynebacterium sp.]